jgi:hypothetical protein
LDLDLRRLTLTFSETINLKSIELDQLTLQSTYTSDLSTQFIIFSSFLAFIESDEDSNIVNIGLSNNLFFQIKHFTKLSKSIDSSYISISPSFVSDMAFPKGLRIIEIPSSSALKARVFQPDLQRPFVSSWNLDLDKNQILLVFSKPVDINSMDISQVFFI